MNISEAAGLLLWPRDDVKVAIVAGIAPPGASLPLRLGGLPLGQDYDISDSDLESFIAAFEAAEPGRHPPLPVRRQLLVEARHLCCVCGEPGPFEYHHIIEWGKLQHHDPRQMMLLCRNCHGKCTNGTYDTLAQRAYKATPHWRAFLAAPGVGSTVTWSDLRAVVEALHAHLHPADGSDPRHDYGYLDLDEKNELNRLSPELFAVWREHYEPRFLMVKSFLGDDRNRDVQERYFEIVGDLRTAVALVQGKDAQVRFDDVVKSIFDGAFVALSEGPNLNREGLRTVIAFMYFECDIGRKA